MVYRLAVVVDLSILLYLALYSVLDGIVGRLFVELKRENFLDDLPQRLRHLLEEFSHVFYVYALAQVVLKLIIGVLELLVEV